MVSVAEGLGQGFDPNSILHDIQPTLMGYVDQALQKALAPIAQEISNLKQTFEGLMGQQAHTQKFKVQCTKLIQVCNAKILELGQTIEEIQATQRQNDTQLLQTQNRYAEGLRAIHATAEVDVAKSHDLLLRELAGVENQIRSLEGVSREVGQQTAQLQGSMHGVQVG